MIKNIKNRIRRLLDIRVITLKHLSNNIEKEMRRVSQIRYNIETDRFSNKKIWFKICFFFGNCFFFDCFIGSGIPDVVFI